METFEVYTSLSVQSAASTVDTHMSRNVSCQNLDWVTREAGDRSCVILYYEKYYWRAGNRLTLMVVIDDFTGRTRVRSSGGGGGEGVFIRFDWGAGSHFAHSAIDALQGHLLDEGKH